MEKHLLLEVDLLNGRRPARATAAPKNKYTQVLALREIRNSGAYRNAGLTWEQFCLKYGRLGVGTANRRLRCLDEFGEPYFRLNAIMSVPPEIFRCIAPLVTTHAIELDGEKVEFSPGNYGRIRAGIRSLRLRLRDAAGRCKQFLTPADSPSTSDTDSAR
jgi:hypothetical protein